VDGGCQVHLEEDGGSYARQNWMLTLGATRQKSSQNFTRNSIQKSEYVLSKQCKIEYNVDYRPWCVVYKWTKSIIDASFEKYQIFGIINNKKNILKKPFSQRQANGRTLQVM